MGDRCWDEELANNDDAYGRIPPDVTHLGTGRPRRAWSNAPRDDAKRRLASRVWAAAMRFNSRRRMMTPGSRTGLADHFEQYLGPMEAGWTETLDHHRPGFGVVRFGRG